MNRYISANYLFTITGKILKNGIAELDAGGVIKDIIDTGGNVMELPRLEYYNGIIVPGFVNAHCHLELSYLKGKISTGTGLEGFITEFVKNRDIFNSGHAESIEIADHVMTDNGIAATGDISNNTSTVNTKRNSNIFYHSFIEVYDLFSRNIDNIIDHAKSVMKEFMDLPAGSCSITPHSPYTVSGDLFDTVGKIALNNNGIISVHNQESEAEDELFQKKDGRLFRKLQCLGTDLSRFKATGRSSLQSFLKKLPSSVNILLVHNTFTKEEDIDFTSEYSDNIYWVLCPGSNLFIGNRLPDVELFSKKNLKVALGTDSYASNRRLSVLEEMKTISGHYPSIPFADLIKWGTLNGAEALNISRKYGSLEPGKAPGINLIENFDLGTMSLKENSSVRVLVKPISDLNNENF